MKQRGKPPTVIEVESRPGRRPHAVLHLTDAFVEDHEIFLSPTAAKQLALEMLAVVEMLDVSLVHEG